MIKHFRTLSCLLLTVTIAVATVGSALAHGTAIAYQVEDGMVTIDAVFDSGEPMANAQIVAYAPDNPSEPYYQGITDENGHIAFPIDPTITGSWDISVRTAGHGEMLHIPVDSTTSLINAGNEGRSQSRTILLAGGVLLALGGVALYFMRSKQTDARS